MCVVEEKRENVVCWQFGVWNVSTPFQVSRFATGSRELARDSIHVNI